MTPVPVLANTLCPGCRQRIGSVDHCTEQGYPFVIDGDVQWLSAIPYGDDREDWTITPPERCHDCGVKVGEVHHWGCDMAQCPNCDQQLLGCECDMRSEADLTANR